MSKKSFVFEGRGRDTYYGSPAVLLKDGCVFKGTESDAKILRDAGFGVREYQEFTPAMQEVASPKTEKPAKKAGKKNPKKVADETEPAPVLDTAKIKERAIVYAKGSQEEKEDYAIANGWDGEQDLEEWFKSGMK